MNIQLFLNKKGLIYGDDPKRITCDSEGLLKIGNAEIEVTPHKECIMPTLFYGASGRFGATYLTNGELYELGEVVVRKGRIEPPSPQTVEIMVLQCRADKAEKERDQLKADVEELRNIFDTNSLNFLIGQGE
jgi:hypothetical protein